MVYTLGNMVNRHAWRFYGEPKWTKLDLTEIPEGVPTAAKAGAQSLVVVRQGETMYAMHAQCAHAGGPLAEGKLVDGCIQCPWHGSCYDLGHRAADARPHHVRPAALRRPRGRGRRLGSPASGPRGQNCSEGQAWRADDRRTQAPRRRRRAALTQEWDAERRQHYARDLNRP